MPRISLEPLGSPIKDFLGPGEQERNRIWMGELDEQLRQRRSEVRRGWGDRYLARLRHQGKLTTWERLERLADPETRLLPLGTFVNWKTRHPSTTRTAPGAGVVTAFARVHDRWVVAIANDNLVASGAWWPRTPEKIQRAQAIALRLGLPVVYLVESSGLFLPEQSATFAGRTGAGGIFRMNGRLSEAGVPQLAGVFGPCIAGGGYMPIISDRVVMTERAYMVIAGAALIEGAKAQQLTSLDIGGPEVHVHQSGCADLRVPDDETCIRVLRDEVARLPGSAAPYYRQGAGVLPPSLPAAELRSLFPPDHRETYDVREVLARLVDGSIFHEILPDQGQEVVAGVARVGGLWVGLMANNPHSIPHPRNPRARRAGSILYREGVAKMATFARHCDTDGLPLVWFQDVAGFDIGREAEAEGLLGHGSSLIHTNANLRIPVIAVLLRRASGAGYYAQSGLPYEPMVQLSTPMTRLAVMEGRTLARATCGRGSKRPPDSGPGGAPATPPPHDSGGKPDMFPDFEAIRSRIERDMDPYETAARMDTDEIVSVEELRLWLEALVEMGYQATGIRRIRNPRIWSLHDLEVLCTGP